MAERARSSNVQLGDLVQRIERMEAQLRGLAARPPEKSAGAGAAPQCTLPEVPERTFAPDVSAGRMKLIRVIGKKWVNGTKLRYYFFEGSPWGAGNDQKDLVREGFDVWKDVGIGISFEEVSNISDAEVRIGFLRGDGAWSYVGRDVIDIPGQNERTMNFGWDLRTDPRGVDVPVHEIGHTLGFPHEHQNPFAGIVWNEEAVYDYFAGSPNFWPRQTTFHNILRKLVTSEVEGSDWDPNSIMHYGFVAGLIERPEEYQGGLTPAGGLTAKDMDTVRTFYPPITTTTNPELKPFHSEAFSLAPAEQTNFSIKPAATRRYTIQTFGGSDTVIVLFDDVNGDLRYVDGDDDSGTSLNAKIVTRLEAGHRYVLRIRLYSNWAGGQSAVMLW